MKNQPPRYAGLLLCALLALTACHKKSGEAIVTEKEHIPAASPGATPAEHQLDKEQWIVKVEMVSDRRKVRVLVEQSDWERIKPGDRLHVTYREGKYTGTIWASEID